MNKNEVQKRFIHLQGELERAGFLIQSARYAEDVGGIGVYCDYVYDGVRILEKTACGLRELVLATTFDDKRRLMTEIVEVHGITVEFADGWYKVALPALLPSKKHGHSCSFIVNPLRYAMERFEREHKPERLRDCVICFRHIYRDDYPERGVRDHDNIEVKKVQDVIADKLIVDDSGRYCRNLNVSVSGSKDGTEVYVVPAILFPAWLEKYPI